LGLVSGRGALDAAAPPEDALGLPETGAEDEDIKPPL
jgi:hypothetical protein